MVKWCRTRTGGQTMRSRKVCTSTVVAAIALAGLSSNVQAENCQELRDLGDTLTWALPVSAIALTALKRDGEGGIQLTRTMVMTGAGAGLFKRIGDKTRPDAMTSRQSFVSGHAAGAFMGASYLYTRYGKGWGIPAYGLAILTAYSRTCAQKHFQDDVLGGAMVAMMSNWYSTSPYPDSGRMYPSFTSNGLTMSWSGAFGGNRHPVDIDNFDPSYRIVFEFGPVVQDKNIVRAPNNGGTDIDLAALETEFHMTARMQFERYFNKKSEFVIWYGPMGMTDFDQPTQPFRVGDTIFDPSDPDAVVFDSNYRWWDLRASYRYRLIDNDKWRVRVGAGLQYSSTDFEVEQRDDAGVIVKSAHEEVHAILPVLHASAKFNFNERWAIEAEIDGMSTGKEDYINSGVYIRYQPTLLWDLSFGGRLIHGTLDHDEMYNEIELSDYTFQIGRSF